MNKKEIYAILSTRNIWHEVTEHKAVYNMAEVAEIHLPYPEADAKNPARPSRPFSTIPATNIPNTSRH